MISLSIILLVVIVVSINLVVEISPYFFTWMVVCETAVIAGIIVITRLIFWIRRIIAAIILIIVAVFAFLLVL
jgi:hypothetical protein